MPAAAQKVIARLERRPPPAVARAPARRSEKVSARARRIDRAARPGRERPSILWPQRAPLRVSSPEEPAEREAEKVAKTVVHGSAGRVWPPGAAARVARASHGRRVHRQAAAQRSADEDVSREIQQSANAGSPLPAGTREFMEERFGADFSEVRVHTDGQAERLAGRLAARAFTYGKDIYFGRGEYRPNEPEGAELLAHELTHTIQQQAVVQRDAEAGVAQRPAGRVQRLGLSDVLDGLAELAANVPGYTLLTLIIGRNPINMRVVERNLTNLLRGFLGLVPLGELIFQVLDRYGVIERIGDWINRQTTALGLNFTSIRDAFTRFTDSLGWRDIFSPGDVWRRARGIFEPFFTRLVRLGRDLVSQAITWLKETFMQPLSDFCREIPGYGIVKVMLGHDPFTNAAVPRTPLNVVRAFAEFIPGGTEKVDQLVQSRGLQRAYQWFVTETQARNLTWARVTGTFRDAWNSLHAEDVVHPIDTLRRMIRLFRPLLSDLVGFARAALMKILEFIFEAAMGAGGARILAILKRARGAFMTIVRDPVRFLRNLLGAVGQGVRQFMHNILAHLRDGVIAWLTGPVAAAGVQMPERWDLRGIIWFVLQILGLTWDRVRQKLVRLMGERAVSMLEAGFQLIQEIREKGIVQALRDRVTEFFGNLRDAALGAIKNFIQHRLVMAGIQQLLSLLSPVGAVIQAIIKIYNTVEFFIQRINQILALVESVVNSIASIAAGAIGAAANYVERTMARTIPVILDFLARFIGLGDVGAQVQAAIRRLQAAVDRMLDRAVDWIRRQAARLGGAVADRARAMGLIRYPEKRFSDGTETHRIHVREAGATRRLMIASAPVPMTTFLDRVQANSEIPASRKATIPRARSLAAEIEAVIASANAAGLSDAQRTALLRPMQPKEEELATLIQAMLRNISMSAFDERYSLEGMVATYGAMPRQRRDMLTPDHQPQASVLQYAANVRIGSRLLFANRRLRTVVAGGHVDGGLAINLHHRRHVAGRTYGRGPNRSAIDAAVAGSAGNEDRQRDAVIRVLRSELNADVAAMRRVASQKTNRTIWADMYDLRDASGQQPTAAQRTRLINSVSTRIVLGEARMAAQDLNALKRP